MTTLLSLVGEQPMPALLPDRFVQPEHTLLIGTSRSRPVAERLQKLLPHATIEETDPYDLPKILVRLAELAPAGAPMLINLTGGAKMMMLGAFALAMQRGWEFVYLESEHRPVAAGALGANGGGRCKDATPLRAASTAGAPTVGERS